MKENFNAVLNTAAVQTLTRAFTEAGFELALVGGAVRDLLSGGEVNDFDFCTNALPEQTEAVLKTLGTVWMPGFSFGTVCSNVEGEVVEVTTFRTETYTEDSRAPQTAFGTSLVEDLARRDLTMNAIALNLSLSAGQVVAELVDPFNGANDLAAGVLRTPSDTLRVMSEDPLRMLRAVRFAVVRSMRLDEELAEVISANADRLDIISAERKLSQLEKLLVSSKFTREGLKLSMEVNVSEKFFSAFASEEALTALNRLDGGRSENLLLLAVASSNWEKGWSELKMSREDNKFLTRLTREVATLRTANFTRALARKLVRKFTDEELSVLLNVTAAFGVDVASLRLMVGDVQDNELEVRAVLPVDGKDAMAAGLKGKAVGEALKLVEERLLAQGFLTRDEALSLLK